MKNNLWLEFDVRIINRSGLNILKVVKSQNLVATCMNLMNFDELMLSPVDV